MHCARTNTQSQPQTGRHALSGVALSWDGDGPKFHWEERGPGSASVVASTSLLGKCSKWALTRTDIKSKSNARPGNV